MDFEFIEAYKDRYPIRLLTGMTQISRSYYYKLLKGKKLKTQAERDKPLLNQMLSLYVTHGGNLGNVRFKDELYRQYGVVVNVKRVRRMRKMYNLPLKTQRRKPRMDGGPVHHIVDNLLERNFRATKPGKKLCIDITYLKVTKPRENFLFLCAIKDVYNNEIVAYSIGEDMTIRLVFQALNQLKEKGLAQKNAILHSDQGVQFTSPRYVKRLKDMHLVQSMSRRGNCWDNACIESFFGKLKTEMPGFSIPETQDEMIQAVTDYIAYYNVTRPQLKFKMSPVAYRLAQAA
ncbi:transposase InsO family protein [Sporosarcina luteola]|nr:transposase InsO family protein [Sporosarcina luteola]